MNFMQVIESKDLQGLKGITITLNYKEKNNALLLASREGFIEGVEMLIEAKADVNTKDEFKRTPLHLSILGGFSAIALFLIKNGAGLENTDCYGRTSLHYAVKRNDLEVTKEIVKVHYERKSAFSSWLNMFNIFLHIRNIKNALHPFKAYEGMKNKACHEFINKSDVLGVNAFKYSLTLEGADAQNMQVFLLINGAVPEEKLSLLEASALMGLQMYLGNKITELGIRGAFAGLRIVANNIEKMLPPIPQQPQIDFTPEIKPEIEIKPSVPTFGQDLFLASSTNLGVRLTRNQLDNTFFNL
jgi:hypothetical protein